MSVAPLSIGELANVAKSCFRGGSYGDESELMICGCLSLIAKENRSAFLANYKHSPSIIERYKADIRPMTAKAIWLAAKQRTSASLVSALSTAGLLRYNTNPTPRARGRVNEACCIVLEMLCIGVSNELPERTNPRRRSARR